MRPDCFAHTAILEMLFALLMLQSAWFSLRKLDEAPAFDQRQIVHAAGLDGWVPGDDGRPLHYGVANLPGGAALMVVAGVMSGLLGIGSGALKVVAMDQMMHLPLKVSTRRAIS